MLKKLYNAKIKDIEDEISDITTTNITNTNFTNNSALNTKINEVNGKISSITNLAATTASTAVENKIRNVNNLVKKTDYNTKINEIEKKKLLIIIIVISILLHNNLKINVRKICFKINTSKFSMQK